MQKGVFQLKIIINVLVCSSCFIEYLCYESTPIVNILIHYMLKYEVYRRQILTYKVLKLNEYKQFSATGSCGSLQRDTTSSC